MNGRATLMALSYGWVAGFLACGASRAASELSYGLDAGIGYSDNVTRTEGSETSDTFTTVGGHFLLAHESARSAFDAEGALEWVDYLGGTFESDLLGEVRAAGRLRLVGEQLDWVVEESFGQGRITPLEPVTPENLENVSYFSTGPELRLRLTEVDDVIASGRFGDVTYEESTIDSRRYLGSLEWLRRLGSRRSVSLFASAEHFDYQGTVLQAPTDRREYLVRMSSEGSRSSVRAHFGFATVESGGDPETEAVASVSLTREASRNLDINVSLGSEFSDAADLFRSRVEDADPDLGLLPVVPSTAVVESRYASTLWSLAHSRSALDLYGEYRDEQYQGASFPDRTVAFGRVDFTHRLRPRTTVRLYALAFRENFVLAQLDSTERHFGAALEWQVGRRLSAGAQVLRRERDESDGQSEELLGHLRLTLELGSSRAERSTRGRGARE